MTLVFSTLMRTNKELAV